jgi:hypothetical protein
MEGYIECYILGYIECYIEGYVEGYIEDYKERCRQCIALDLENKRIAHLHGQ